MTDQTPVKHSRVRASERAVTAALRALQAVGLPVDKVCVSGGQVEIHCGGIERQNQQPENEDGIEQW